MQYGKQYFFISLLTLVIFTACSDGTTTPDHYWGYLTPETKGIYYECRDLSGKTGPEGRFNYHKGEEVRFYLGDIELGTVIGGQIVTPFSLAGHDPVPADFDTALANDMEDYPKARNIMHFLLAINELYDSGSSSYLYEELVETFESMHLELNGKTLDFSDIAIGDFQAQLDNLSSRRISLGGLNLIGTTLITENIQDLDTKVANAQNRPEFLYDYSDVDYTGVSSPPVDGEVLTEEQIHGVWISEWGIYGDRGDGGTPDSVYRDDYVQFPQENYFVRFDGSPLEEDFVCGRFQKYYQFDTTTKIQSFYVKIEGPIFSKQQSLGIAINYPDEIYYFETDDSGTYYSRPKDDYIGLFKRAYSPRWDPEVDGYQRNTYVSYSSNSDYAILTFPNIDDDNNGGLMMDGFNDVYFGKPDRGRVNVYDSEMNHVLTIMKIRDDTTAGATEAFFPVDE